MTLVSSPRSRSTGLAVRVVTLTHRGVFVEGAAQDPVQLVTRSSISVSQRNVILVSVFGSLGFVGFVACIIILIYWMRHRANPEDMIIERPTRVLQEIQDASAYQSAPLSTPMQNTPVTTHPRTLDTPDRAYIPNHPYALSYARDSRNSFPPTPPAKATTYPRPPHPPLPTLNISHPYTQTSQPRRHERVPSVDPSTIYESFMTRDSPAPTPEPTIEPMEPSPLASTAGGAMSPHGWQFDALLSATLSDEAPSSMSASSSTPLRPGEKQPRR